MNDSKTSLSYGNLSFYSSRAGTALVIAAHSFPLFRLLELIFIIIGCTTDSCTMIEACILAFEEECFLNGQTRRRCVLLN